MTTHSVKNSSIYIIERTTAINTFGIPIKESFNNIYAVILNQKDKWKKINVNDYILIEDNFSKMFFKVFSKTTNDKNYWVFLEPEIAKYEVK